MFKKRSQRILSDLITLWLLSLSPLSVSSAAPALSPPPQASDAPESAVLSPPASVWPLPAAELSPNVALLPDVSALSPP